MLNQTEMKEWQIEYLDKLEEAMELELKTGYSRRDTWAARFEAELERPGYSEEAKLRISWLLYHVLDDDNRDPSDIFVEQMEIASMTPAEKDDILFSRLPRLWEELEELERELPPSKGDVYMYLNAVNTVLQSQNERLKAENNHLKSENESLKQALLAVCRYYSQSHRRTPRVAEDVLFFLTELNQVGIPLVPDAQQQE